jgi:tRNA (cmo5U34)-methyltransferase
MQDNVTPAGKWAFDGDVTACFDDMLSRSIPQYEVMRATTFELAAKFVKEHTAIVDLGCSRGEALAPFVQRFGAHNRYIGCDVSDPMIEAAQARFQGYIDSGIVDIRKVDLRTDYPPAEASVTLAVLTLQFVPIEYRQSVVRKIFKHTVPGGCCILVEKVLGNTAELNEAMVTQYYELKAENGYTQDAIDRKRLSLEGVLVPVTSKWNWELLKQAGFQHIDCYWRWMNFSAWVAIRE